MDAVKCFVALAFLTGLLNSHASAEPGEPVSSVAQSDNFVVCAPSPELAEDVLAQAESLRARIAEQWLGEKLPAGIGPAIIRVRLSDTEDEGRSWVADSAARLSHLMWLTTTRERALGTTLAHEMTHVVLATQFPGKLPAWASEGAAGLEDDAARVATRQRIISWYARTGNWPDLEKVLAPDRIVPTDRTRYALAVSVTEYLLLRGNRRTFLEFAVDGKSNGWPMALQRYYQIRDIAELESAWRSWATDMIGKSTLPSISMTEDALRHASSSGFTAPRF
jgi:hypothetical protein